MTGLTFKKSYEWCSDVFLNLLYRLLEALFHILLFPFDMETIHSKFKDFIKTFWEKLNCFAISDNQHFLISSQLQSFHVNRFHFNFRPKNISKLFLSSKLPLTFFFSLIRFFWWNFLLSLFDFCTFQRIKLKETADGFLINSSLSIRPIKIIEFSFFLFNPKFDYLVSFLTFFKLTIFVLSIFQ